MTAYRLPYKYRRHYGRNDNRSLAVAAGIVAVFLATSGARVAHHGASPVHQAAADAAAVQAIAYARQQLGNRTAGAGPAWWGLRLLRLGDGGVRGGRSQHPAHQRGAVGGHCRTFRPARSGPVTSCSFPAWTAPGPRRVMSPWCCPPRRCSQAYATGYPIEVSPLNGDGAGGIVGYARPS